MVMEAYRLALCCGSKAGRTADGYRHPHCGQGFECRDEDIPLFHVSGHSLPSRSGPPQPTRTGPVIADGFLELNDHKEAAGDAERQCRLTKKSDIGIEHLLALRVRFLLAILGDIGNR